MLSLQTAAFGGLLAKREREIGSVIYWERDREL
jgi:hypothetical protein